jgi:hypothetical protein
MLQDSKASPNSKSIKNILEYLPEPEIHERLPRPNRRHCVIPVLICAIIALGVSLRFWKQDLVSIWTNDIEAKSED